MNIFIALDLQPAQARRPRAIAGTDHVVGHGLPDDTAPLGEPPEGIIRLDRGY